MTTLAEIERLVRRIEEALENPAPNVALSKLAADFQTLARAAALRLSQCSSMLASGSEFQALQLAETQPPLLDVLTLLSFRRSPEWRARCQAENLPAAETFDIKPVRQLNDLYARGIDKDHALYRDYRRAVMLNDDARALAILRSITRLNGNDANARVELERLEKKQRAEKIRKLEQLVSSGINPGQIADLADELEALPEAAESDAWPEAQSARARRMLRLASESQRANEVSELGRLLHKLATLTPFLDETERAELARLEGWFAADVARRREAAGRKAAIDQLASAIQNAPENERTLPELRVAAANVERAWRHVEEARAELPPEFLARAQKHRYALNARIHRSERASRQIAYATVAAIVLVCLGAAWFAFSQHAATTLAAQLRTFIADRRVAETESALAASAGQRASAELAQARDDGNAFVQRERAAKANADALLANVEQFIRQNFTNAPPETIAASFAQASAAAASLAPEFRAVAESALAKTQLAWKSYLDQKRAQYSRTVIALIDATASAAANELVYTLAPERAAAVAEKFAREIAPASRLVDAPVPEMRPSQEALFKFQNLETAIERFGRDATNYLRAQQSLASTNLAAYTNALQLLASSGFTPAPQRASVAALATLNMSAQTLVPALLEINFDPAANLISIPARRIPEQVLPAERDIQRKLRDDENIQNVSRLAIEVKALPPNDPRRRRIVYVRGELQRRITRRSGQVYDPVEKPAALEFALRDLGALEYNIEELAPTPEKELYDRSGLARLLDGNTGQYQTSLLQTLDDINQDRRASPLFRAWLFLQVCEMIDAQPLQWGAAFAPALALDRAELLRRGANQIRTGDWFVPAKIAPRSSALATHFERAALRSYARQSAFFKRLLPKAIEAGVALVGHANSEGQPILNDSAIAIGPIFGFAAANAAPAPVMIFEKALPNEPARMISKPCAYSPLFIFAGNSAALVDETLRELGYAAAALGFPDALPPLLRNPQ
jgi:hypothetical protein